MTETRRPFDLWSFAPRVLLPTTVFATANGTAAPLHAVLAHDLGADLATAGLVAAVAVVAFLLGNLPTGAVIHALGERRAMLAAGVLSLLGLAISALGPDPAVLAAGAFLAGFAEPTYHIARQALVAVAVPATHRARVLSVQAGALRLGVLTGPLLAGVVIATTGSVRAVYPAAMVLVAAGMLALRWLPDPGDLQPIAAGVAPRASIVATITAHRGVFGTFAPLIMLVTAVRQGRNQVIPLWGVSLGMDPRDIAWVVGAAAAVDFALAFPSGVVMDRHGRVWAGVPAMALYAAGFLVLAATSFAGAGTPGWFVAGAITLGAANGVSSGIVATIGSDVVGSAHPATFLSVWQLTSNIGGTASPLIVAAVTAAASLAVAAVALGLVGVAGAVLMARLLPRHLPAGPRADALQGA